MMNETFQSDGRFYESKELAHKHSENSALVCRQDENFST
jgi:hypothetical protein